METTRIIVSQTAGWFAAIVMRLYRLTRIEIKARAGILVVSVTDKERAIEQHTRRAAPMDAHKGRVRTDGVMVARATLDHGAGVRFPVRLLGHVY